MKNLDKTGYVSFVGPSFRDQIIEAGQAPDATESQQLAAESFLDVNPVPTRDPSVAGVSFGEAPKVLAAIKAGTPRDELEDELKDELSRYVPEDTVDPLVEPFIDRVIQDGGNVVDDPLVIDVRPLVRRYIWGITGRTDEGVPTFDSDHERFHQYGLPRDPEKSHPDGDPTTTSCSKSKDWCTFENIREGLIRYPAPWIPEGPKEDGDVSFIDNPAAPNIGPVEHVFVNEDGSEIVNVTKKDHLLTPGIVRRWITEDKNTITVHTYGEGVGPLGLANVWFDDPVWSVADKQIMDFAKSQ